MPWFSPPRAASRVLAGVALLLGTLGALWACGDEQVLTARPRPVEGAPPHRELTDVAGSNLPVALALLNGPTKCMTLGNESGVNGTPVVVAPCAGAASERFTWTSAGELRVAVAGVSKCVSSNGSAGSAGDVIMLWDCGGTANQHWAATAAGEVRGLNGLCLDVSNNAADGAQAVLWGCYGTAVSWQRWAARGGSRSVVFVSTTTCGVSYTAVTSLQDAELGDYGVPTQTDTTRVCETWSGSDYAGRMERVCRTCTAPSRSPIKRTRSAGPR